jgi:hypothetical protein
LVRFNQILFFHLAGGYQFRRFEADAGFKNCELSEWFDLIAPASHLVVKITFPVLHLPQKA